MQKGVLATVSGPNSINEIEHYCNARTHGMIREAFREIEHELCRLQEAQEKVLSDGFTIDQEEWVTLLRSQARERQIQFQVLKLRWGSQLTLTILSGLGFDPGDYALDL